MKTILDSTTKQPTVIIVAGAHASGKSTLIATLYNYGIFATAFIRQNEDEIQEIGNMEVSIQRNKLIKEKQSFVMETVLSSKHDVELIKTLKSAGYEVEFIYIGTSDVKINASYLIDRIRKGGEDVALKKLIHRHAQSLYYARECAELADISIFIDNSIPNDIPILINSLNTDDRPDATKWLLWIGNMAFEKITNNEKRLEFRLEYMEKISKAIEGIFLHYTGVSAEFVNRMKERIPLEEGELRAILRYTTNHGMSLYQNILGSLYLSTKAKWHGRYRDETFYTSPLKDYEFNGQMLTLYTLNSTYIFEIVRGELDPLLITKADENLIQTWDNLNNTPFKYWYCQISGFALIDNAISVTVLPRPMTRQQVIDYTASHDLRDVGGNIVKNILGPDARKDIKKED